MAQKGVAQVAVFDHVGQRLGSQFGLVEGQKGLRITVPVAVADAHPVNGFGPRRQLGPDVNGLQGPLTGRRQRPGAAVVGQRRKFGRRLSVDDHDVDAGPGQGSGQDHADRTGTNDQYVGQLRGCCHVREVRGPRTLSRDCCNMVCLNFRQIYISDAILCNLGLLDSHFVITTSVFINIFQ